MAKKSSSASAIATEILLDKIALLFESMKNSDTPSSIDFKLMRRYLSELQSGVEGWEAASVDSPAEKSSARTVTHKRVEEVRVQPAAPAPAVVRPAAAPEPPMSMRSEPAAINSPAIQDRESIPEVSTSASGNDSETKQSSDSGWNWGDPIKDKEPIEKTPVQESIAESDSAGSNQPNTVGETSEAPKSGNMEPAQGQAATVTSSEKEEGKESSVSAASVVADMQESEPSLNDRFSSQSGNDVASATASVRNGLELRRLIDINERFLFTSQLFGGDSDAYRTAVRQLDEMPGFEAAESHARGHLGSKYNWDLEGKVVQHFLDILAQRYGVSR